MRVCVFVLLVLVHTAGANRIHREFCLYFALFCFGRALDEQHYAVTFLFFV